jgi:hypothetical protein
MEQTTTPVAARATHTADAVSADGIHDDANVHVTVSGATKRFHLWQQLPAWVLGLAALALGFVMVVRGYDSPAGWLAVSTSVIISVVASFRAPFSIGETAVSSAPGHRPKKKPAPSTNPPTEAAGE